MDSKDYDLLIDSCKKIVFKSFSDYKKQYGSNDIYGIVLYIDVFETHISMGIITNEHLKYMGMSVEDLKKFTVPSDYIVERMANSDEWYTIIENDELTAFTKTVKDNFPFPLRPVCGKTDASAFITRTSELMVLPYDVLAELHEEHYFKEFGDNFALVYASTDGRGFFACDIKDKLFDYKASGWRRDVFASFDEDIILEEDEE